jgi:uncharacterized membrane protein
MHALPGRQTSVAAVATRIFACQTGCLINIYVVATPLLLTLVYVTIVEIEKKKILTVDADDETFAD